MVRGSATSELVRNVEPPPQHQILLNQIYRFTRSIDDSYAHASLRRNNLDVPSFTFQYGSHKSHMATQIKINYSLKIHFSLATFLIPIAMVNVLDSTDTGHLRAEISIGCDRL